jgi:hypothetical protein
MSRRKRAFADAIVSVQLCAAWKNKMQISKTKPTATGASARQIQTAPDPEIRSWRSQLERGSAAHSIPRGSPPMEQAEWRSVHS